jgi:hypothetical protein
LKKIEKNSKNAAINKTTKDVLQDRIFEEQKKLEDALLHDYRCLRFRNVRDFYGQNGGRGRVDRSFFKKKQKDVTKESCTTETLNVPFKVAQIDKYNYVASIDCAFDRKFGKGDGEDFLRILNLLKMENIEYKKSEGKV